MDLDYYMIFKYVLDSPEISPELVLFCLVFCGIGILLLLLYDFVFQKTKKEKNN